MNVIFNFNFRSHLAISKIAIFSFLIFTNCHAQEFDYTIAISETDTYNHTYQVQLRTSCDTSENTIFRMPNWMPGYYQIMHYGKDVSNFQVKDHQGKKLNFSHPNEQTWVVENTKNKRIIIDYQINTHKEFVANSYIDADHAYVIPCNSFLYLDGHLNEPVKITIIKPSSWENICTGLAKMEDKFVAPNFDILYDSPFLIGNLETVGTFKVNDVDHSFIGYKVGDFDKKNFIKKLQAVVEASVEIIGEIPYDDYTFIGIGPGRGGIEHLNNTTVSFDGNKLNSPESVIGVMNFLAHEYFHHYNVKRIRPLELGPFDYEMGSRSNLLWISEGLTVYYEFLIVNRARISDGQQLLHEFEGLIKGLETNEGRKFQSLTQASYNTWKDGPFGGKRSEKGKTISYYQKGPIVGLLLDLAIRDASKNDKSLDDVMKYLYNEFYKKKQRGFTDAEFQQACEKMAGGTLEELFEYVNTTTAINYNKYLSMAGMDLSIDGEDFEIHLIENPSELQKQILSNWMRK